MVEHNRSLVKSFLKNLLSTLYSDFFPHLAAFIYSYVGAFVMIRQRLQTGSRKLILQQKN